MQRGLMKKTTRTGGKTISFKWLRKRTSVRLTGDEIDAILYLYHCAPNDLLAKRILPLAVEDLLKHVTSKELKNLTQILRNQIIRRLAAKCPQLLISKKDAIDSYRELYVNHSINIE